MTDDRFELSRRKVLAGVGTVGAAGVGAGLGTSAYFSDEESFDGNQITAGELDLWVSASATYDSDGQAENQADVPIELTDGSELPAAIYELDDVKPGDSGTAEICFSSVDNPAWIWAQGLVTANDENGYTEPEPDSADGGDVNDPGDPDGEGELADALESTLYYDGNGNVELDGDEEVFGELFDGDFSSWQLLDGDGDDGEFSGSSEPSEEHCLVLGWELPEDVGNEVQTDSLEFAISLYAEQYRHNGAYAAQDICYSSPDNPGADVETEDVFELCIDYQTDGDELESVIYTVHLDEPWSDPNEANSNFALGFAGTQDTDDLPLDPVADYQISWRDGDYGRGFYFSQMIEEGGEPVWEKDTNAGWQELPDPIEAERDGTTFTIEVPIEAGFPYQPGDIYGILGNASYGGATHANISTDPSSAWSSADNFTSTENFIPTKIPDDA